MSNVNILWKVNKLGGVALDIEDISFDNLARNGSKDVIKTDEEVLFTTTLVLNLESIIQKICRDSLIDVTAADDGNRKKRKVLI